MERDNGGGLDVFTLRQRLVDDYRAYTAAFVDPCDPRVRDFLNERLDQGAQWARVDELAGEIAAQCLTGEHMFG